MGTASNAKISYESGQDLVAFVALTDQGDHKDFRSADALWSNRAGYTPDIKPNGLATGCAITPAANGTTRRIVSPVSASVAAELVLVGSGVSGAAEDLRVSASVAAGRVVAAVGAAPAGAASSASAAAASQRARCRRDTRRQADDRGCVVDIRPVEPTGHHARRLSGPRACPVVSHCDCGSPR